MPKATFTVEKKDGTVIMWNLTRTEARKLAIAKSKKSPANFIVFNAKRVKVGLARRGEWYD